MIPGADTPNSLPLVALQYSACSVTKRSIVLLLPVSALSLDHERLDPFQYSLRRR